MFVGHLAVALAAKRLSPRVSLGWLMAGVVALDLLWPIFLILGLEHVNLHPGAGAGGTAFTPVAFTWYPWSHSLAMAIVWGLLFMAIGQWRRLPVHPAWLLAALVVSHWVLDFASHAPDMPLWPTAGSPRLGLGLWNSIPATLVVEGAMWVAGIAIYLRGRRPTRWIGPVAFWSLTVVCTVMWATGPWSPVPSSNATLGWFAMIGWLVPFWAALADRYHATAP